MRLGGIASFLAEITSRDTLTEAVSWATERQLPYRMIGGGSNIFWHDSGFNGLVLVNKIAGYTTTTQQDGSTYVTIGAGENWDSAVSRTVSEGLTGIEALSLIPGTAGATPIQNVGAYGQDISQTLVSLEALDTATGQFVVLSNKDCQFSYRSSAFKNTTSGRYLITSITLRLITGNPLPPYYGAVQTYLETNPTDQAITPSVLREAVIAIRSSKLPDPSVVANNGSFFANPTVDEPTFVRLRAQNPNMPNWPLEDGSAKIPAAWLLEQAGFKDFHDAETGMSTWHLQPLVLVNEAAKTTSDLLTFKQKIVDAVQAKFGITLAQEPELLP